MKNWKRVVIGAAAAALLVTGAAAATVTGVSQRLLDYLGVGPEDSQTAELLIPGAMAVDITKEDNGAVFHVSQVLRDRTSILVLADFPAPEGTSLWMGERNGEEPQAQAFMEAATTILWTKPGRESTWASMAAIAIIGSFWRTMIQRIATCPPSSR